MKNEIYGSHKSSIFGVDANIVALLTYFATMIIGWIPVINYVSFFAPLIIYILERNSSFVKFHAMQAFLLNALVKVVTIISGVIAGVTGVGLALGSIGTGVTAVGFAFIFGVMMFILGIIVFIFTLIAAIQAAQYKEYHIPIIGSWAARISGTE